MPEPKLEIPVAAPFLLATIEHTHARLRVIPNDDAQLAYEILVPKSWVHAKAFGPAPSGLLQTQGLGIFAQSGRPGAPVIAVNVSAIPYEVPIDTWTVTELITEGWTVIASQWIPGASGLYFDVTVVRGEGDAQVVRRSSARVRGPQLFVVHCTCGREYWDTFKEIFWAASDGFELSVKGPTRMEPWLGGSAQHPDFAVAYPHSWAAEPVDVSREGLSALDVRLIDGQGETLLAYLQIKAQRRAESESALPVRELEAAALLHLEKSGFTRLDEPQPLSIADDPRSVSVEGWLGGFAARGRLGVAEVFARQGFMDHAGITFTFSLLSPRMSEAPLIALRAQRVFEIARATLKVPP